MENRWQDQLKEVVLETYRRQDTFYFGHNIEWREEGVREFLRCVEAFGAWDIEVPDSDTIRFCLPEHDEASVSLLLFVMTSHPRPCDVKYDRKKDRLTLSWDY